MNKLDYLMAIKGIRDTLPDDRRPHFDIQLEGREKTPVLALVLGLYAGTFGIDRFYIGSVGLGILKLFTFGCFGIFTVVDWFLIMGAARKRNLALAHQVRAMVAS